MNKVNTLLVASMLALGATVANAAEPTEITDAVSSLTAGFTSVKGLIITVVTFGLVVGYIKLLRRK